MSQHSHCPAPCPPAPQLAAMARDDPASLAAVANFTVGRRGVGSVRWLEPTDVRGLDLDATVQLSKGSIEVRWPGRQGCPQESVWSACSGAAVLEWQGGEHWALGGAMALLQPAVRASGTACSSATRGATRPA